MRVNQDDVALDSFFVKLPIGLVDVPGRVLVTRGEDLDCWA